MKYLRANEQKRLIEVATENGISDLFIITFFIETGARFSEAFTVTWDEVLYKDSFFMTTLKQSTNKRREMPVSKRLKEVIAEYKPWFLKKNMEAHNKEHFVFLSKFRTPLTPGGMNFVIRKNLKQAGLESFNIHSLRHTFAKNLMKRDIDLVVIQKLLGHSSLANTAVYLEPDRDEIFEAFA